MFPLPDFSSVPSNSSFTKAGRCLLFAEYSKSSRDCYACRTIYWCKFYDRLGLRVAVPMDLARWEDDGGAARDSF
jgi:hypothetical protein